MRQETKIIYAAIDDKEDVGDVDDKKCEVEPCIQEPQLQMLGQPTNTTAICECSQKPLTYRELTKGAREIMELKAGNFNTLFKQQNSNFPHIDSVKFIEFEFGNNALLGKFKASYIEKNELCETIVFANWNGASLRVY